MRITVAVRKLLCKTERMKRCMILGQWRHTIVMFVFEAEASLHFLDGVHCGWGGVEVSSGGAS